jgi:transposase-like protein
LQGVEFITSDDHPGLKAARQAVLPGARWHRCQFHLAQNAIHHAPNQTIRKAIGEELRAVWDASGLGNAQEELKRLVAKYRSSAPKLAEWLENSVSEGFAVFKLPSPENSRWAADVA